MNKLINLAKQIDQINYKLFTWFSYSIIVIICVGFIVLMMRYLFNYGRIWVYEIMDYGFSILITTTFAGAWINRSHVSIDIFFNKFSEKTQNYIYFVGSAFIVPCMMFSILFFSFSYVVSSWQHLEGSRQTGGLDGLFIIKSFLIIMVIMILFQSFSFSIKSAHKLGFIK